MSLTLSICSGMRLSSGRRFDSRAGADVDDVCGGVPSADRHRPLSLTLASTPGPVHSDIQVSGRSPDQFARISPASPALRGEREALAVAGAGCRLRERWPRRAPALLLSVRESLDSTLTRRGAAAAASTPGTMIYDDLRTRTCESHIHIVYIYYHW